MIIVAFGDSITAGKAGNISKEEHFLSILGSKLGDGFTLINAGVGGNSAREAMARYEKDVLSHDPDLIMLEFGGNNHDLQVVERRVSDEEFREHLRVFKEKLPPHCKVLVMTFPPIINELHSYHKLAPEKDLDGDLESQRQIVRDFAAENGYPLLDLHKLMYEDRYELLLPDGVHHNRAGHALMGEKLYEVLKEYLDL